MHDVLDEGEMEGQLKKILKAERLKYLPWFTIAMSFVQLCFCIYHSVEFGIGGGEQNNMKIITVGGGTSAGLCERQLDQGGLV